MKKFWFNYFAKFSEYFEGEYVCRGDKVLPNGVFKGILVAPVYLPFYAIAYFLNKNL